MNPRLIKDLTVLRSITERFNKINPKMVSVWPAKGGRIGATNLSETLLIGGHEDFPLRGGVNLDSLLQALKNAPAGAEIESAGDGLLIRWKGGQEEIQASMVPADVPTDLIKETPRRTALSIPYDALAYCMRAMSTEAIRPTLSCLYLDGDKRMIASSDGKRLHYLRFPSERKFPPVLIPMEAVKALMAMSKSMDFAPIEFLSVPEGQKDPEKVFLRLKHMLLGTRCNQGKFPDYEAVLPKTYRWMVELDTADLTKALKETGDFLKGSVNKANGREGTMHFSIGTNKPLQIIAVSEKGRRASSEIRVRGYKGFRLGIQGRSFNPKYLLQTMWSSPVTTIMGNESDKAIGVDGCSVLMPLCIDVGTDVTVYKKEADKAIPGGALLHPIKPSKESTISKKADEPHEPGPASPATKSPSLTRSRYSHRSKPAPAAPPPEARSSIQERERVAVVMEPIEPEPAPVEQTVQPEPVPVHEGIRPEPAPEVVENFQAPAPQKPKLKDYNFNLFS